MARKENSAKTLERFIGTLLGAAVGDALGGPVEFMTGQEIANRYGTVREMIGGGPYNWRPGEVTDDTYMMLCVAESLVTEQQCSPQDITRRLMMWYQSNPAKDIGNTTREALTRLCEGNPCGARESPTNGSIVRSVPLSLMYFHDEAALIEASMRVSAITHINDEAELSCVFINLMIAKLLTGAGKKDAYVYAVERTRELDRNFVRKYIGSSYNPEPSKGLAVNTMLLATGSVMAAKSFEEAVTKAVNLGGDTDTTGAVTGALAGAYFGRPSIPSGWSTKLNPRPGQHFVSMGQFLFETKVKEE